MLKCGGCQRTRHNPDWCPFKDKQVILLQQQRSHNKGVSAKEGREKWKKLQNTPCWWYASTEEAEEDFWTFYKVNGHQTKMEIDTQAPLTLISTANTEKLHLTLQDLHPIKVVINMSHSSYQSFQAVDLHWLIGIG